eukprot:gene3528-4029_t
MAAAEEPTLRNSLSLSEFIAPERGRKVPNHLLDTKIFAKLGQNEILHTNPSSIHFSGFEVGKVQSKKLRIINASAQRQRMHIIPPTTSNFKIKYTKEDTLVPGLYLEVTVQFCGKENQYYNDCIRIHSVSDENLVVPLYAYPIMDIADFPSNVYFSPTAIGQTKTKIIPLKCSSQVNFDFQISFLQRHSAFDVQPLSGVVPGGGKVDIRITFSPVEYCTAHLQLQVNVSQMNAKPLLCSITGISIPGLVHKSLSDKKQWDNQTDEIVENVADPRALSPLTRSRNRKADKIKSQTALKIDAPKEIEYNGIRFPLQLDNQAAVSYVLTQKAGKIKAKDLREAVKVQSQSTPSNKQTKEAVFEHIVSQNVAEEQRNQLRWCVKLGDDSPSAVEVRKILVDREKANQAYLVGRGDPQLQEELDRSATVTTPFRIHRIAGDFPASEPSFDFYVNDVWTKRHATLRKFILAARKVMIRKRVQKHTKSLGKYISNWSKGKFSVAHSRNWEELDEEQQIINKMSTTLNRKNIKLFSFPDYEDPESKDDMAVDSLGPVHVHSTNVEVKTKVSVFNLRVPPQFKVLGYSQHTTSTPIYVPKGLPRPLRTRPQDFNQDVQKDDVPNTAEGKGSTNGRMKTTNELDEEVQPRESKQKQLKETADANKELANAEIDNESCFHDREFEMVMPPILLKEPKYPHLHIFNPMPGLMVHAPPLQHYETNEENKLLPMPTGTNSRSQIKLDRQDVISGSMTWKRFPFQGLTTLNSSPSMSSVFVPRWSDPFSDDLLPTSTPTLLRELPNEDAPLEEDNDDDETDGSHVGKILVPTMEMVHAQFRIPPAEDDQDREN